VVGEGRQVEVDEHEQIVERVAAIDVAKASGMVCTRVPHPTTAGKRLTRVWDVAATTNAIIELADQLAGQGIERVVVESTSDYWKGPVRHEAPRVRAEVKGLRLRPVAAGR
jgi:transposase